MHNDFESMMKRMFKQMQMMDMHHEHLFEEIGKKHMFTIGRNRHLIDMHKNLGWTVDPDSSHEIIKNI